MNLLREYIRTLLTEADIHGTRVDMYFGTGGDSDLYDELTSLRFPLTVYRGLRLKSGEEIDVRRLGSGGEGDHWSRSRRAAVDFAKGFSSSARKFGDPTLITGQIVSPGDVDWQSTVDLNREHPNEVEIVAFKVSSPQVHSIGEKIRYHEVREYIRTLLTEAAKGPADLPEDVFVVIQDKGNRFRIAYARKNNLDQYVKTGGDAYRKGIPWGFVGIGRPHGEFGPCGGAWEVHGSGAKQGWGPMLYDVAMELASQNGNGLISDRMTVSGDAEKVWKYYLSNRGDVQMHQLDSLEDELTPGVEEDNCEQRLAKNHSYRTGPTMLKNWTESQFSKRYTKAPTMMNTLEAAGKLVMI